MPDYTGLFRLDGMTALVVGAGGIGAEVARGLSAHGASVVCADLDAAAASVEGCRGIALDLTDPEAVAATAVELGAPDILITTVGINVRKRLADLTVTEMRRVVDVNLAGTFHLLHAFGPRMASRGSGSIIAFTSIRGLTVEPGQGVYAATKAGMVQLLRTAAAELGPAGVRCNAIAPGVVDTPLTAQIQARPDWYEAYARKSALGRWARPDELVGAAVFLASPASSYVTGSVLYVDGGWTAIDGRYEPPA
ncbi:MAG TPA: SDR family NAD(P)-dependent oxidoreductase [Mycobacteriales bacterium]|jgi:NAD(P)-dependent dehydrogenase (short-subunit alcohol dehydrogenase family)|nr:SDR family NAD(P)-dependent oxidoreductase [Mycobacteriales bacterium]